MAESVLRFKVETLDANAKIAHLTKKVRGLEVAVKNAGGTTREAGAGFKAFSGGAQAAAVGARGLGAALSAALGPLVAVAAAAASLGQAFDALKQQDFAEAKVKSLGVNSDQLKTQLQDVSRELSGQASVLDLTSAAYDVASAGFTNAADAAKILKAASQGATGGFSDINTVGDATTSVLNAYGLEADKAAKLVDGFIQTQNDGKIVIGEYAANIAKVAPVAAALSIPLEEVNSAVAQITAGGQGAEVTFTALKTAFAQVAAGKVGKEFKALGVEINASTLKSDGLAGTLEKIKKSGADAGTVIKAFGTEAGPSILALLNDTEKYNQLLENQKNAQGAAAKAAFTASDTIEGQLKRLTTAFQNLFSDQSELGILIKETFKVAAVTVEVFGVALSNTLAPIRAIFAAANQVGDAIAEALGFKGVNAAFALEQAFQATLGRAAKFGDFVIGLGVRIGELIGGLASQIITAGKNSLGGVVGFFKTALERIVGFIGRAYNLIPAPIRNFLEKGTSAVTGFVQETIDIGRGVTANAGLTQGQPDIPQNAIQPTGGTIGGGSASNTEQQRLSFLKRQMAAGESIAKQLRREIELRNTSNDLERELLRIKFNFEDVVANINTNAAERQREELLNLAERNRLDQENLVTIEARDKKLQEAFKMDFAGLFKQDQSKLQQFISDSQDSLKDLERVAINVSQGVGNAIADSLVNGIQGLIEGSTKVKDVFANLLKSVGQILMQEGAKMIATYIAIGIAKAFAGLSGGTKFGDMGNFDQAVPGASGFSSPSSFNAAGLFGRANGGPVAGGRPYLVGEQGPELFMPRAGGAVTSNSELRQLMGRSPVSNAPAMNFTFETTNIGGTEYVSREQLEAAMATTRRQAASDGAKRGMNMTLDRMQNSPRTRARVGIS